MVPEFATNGSFSVVTDDSNTLQKYFSFRKEYIYHYQIETVHGQLPAKFRHIYLLSYATPNIYPHVNSRQVCVYIY